MKKPWAKFVVCIVLVLALLTSAYVVVTNYKNSLVIRCNKNEITEGLYTMYMVTEAAQMDRTQYESDQAFFAELKNLVLDRICIDTYYATMCEQEGYALTGPEKAAVEVKVLTEMHQLGFDDAHFYNNEAYLEYFNVTKKDFMEFYTRKALYEKYFLAMSGQTQDVYNSLMSEYQKFIERQKAQKKLESYWKSISILSSNVSKYFQEHRYEYATNYIEVIFMRYPVDENGLVSEKTKNKYAIVSDNARMALHIGGDDKKKNPNSDGRYIHDFPEDPYYGPYVSNAGRMYVDNSNRIADEWGEGFVKQCLEGTVGRTYQYFSDVGVIVYKISSTDGESGYWEEMALTLKTKEIGNKVRKAILQDEYEPIVLNEALYKEVQTPKGDFWQNLLEKS